MICKVIVCTVSKKPINPVQNEVAFVMIFPILIRLAPFLIIKQALIAFFMITMIAYAGLYSYQVVNRIARLLNIKALTV